MIFFFFLWVCFLDAQIYYAISLSFFKFVFEAGFQKSCLVLVRKLLSFQKYANGGGGEVEVSIGVCFASHRFQIAIFQIKMIKTE